MPEGILSGARQPCGSDDSVVIGGSVFLTRNVPPGQRVTLAAPSLEFREPSKNDSYHGDYAI